MLHLVILSLSALHVSVFKSVHFNKQPAWLALTAIRGHKATSYGGGRLSKHSHDFVFLCRSGTRSASWTTAGSSYEPSRSVMSTKTLVRKTTGWPRPSCIATRRRECLSRCVSQCATAPACDPRRPPAEKRLPCSINRPTASESWRGPGWPR